MKTVCVPRGGGWLPLLLLLALHAPAWSSPSRHDRQAYYNPDNTVRDCGFVTSYNNTYFVSPGYDNIDTGTGICTITVNLLSNICQLRLEFIEFEIAQPDDEGFCMTDFFGVSGASEDVPAICGTNTGLHSQNGPGAAQIASQASFRY